MQVQKKRAAEISALLAFSAIYNNDRVGLVLFSSQIEKYIPPKRGLRHGVRLIRDLLAFQPKERGTNLAQAFDFINRVARKRLICFVLSDFQSSNFEKEFLLTAKKEDLVAIRIYDEEEEVLPQLGLVSSRFRDERNTYCKKNFYLQQKKKILSPFASMMKKRRFPSARPRSLSRFRDERNTYPHMNEETIHEVRAFEEKIQVMKFRSLVGSGGADAIEISTKRALPRANYWVFQQTQETRAYTQVR